MLFRQLLGVNYLDCRPAFPGVGSEGGVPEIISKGATLLCEMVRFITNGVTVC